MKSIIEYISKIKKDFWKKWGPKIDWKNKYKRNVLFLLLILILVFFFTRNFFFFPTLLLTILYVAIWYCRHALKSIELKKSTPKDNIDEFNKNKELAVGRIKFIIRAITIPFFIGIVSYLVADRVYSSKEVIIIGISDFSYSDSINFADIYKKQSISKANKLLGGYHPSLAFDIVTVAGGYDQLWEALKDNRIDMAFVSPYNFACKVREEPSEFNNYFKLIGGKYTSIGKKYHAGFLANKIAFKGQDKELNNFKDTIKIKELLSDASVRLKVYLSNEDKSTSGYKIPIMWLKKNNCDTNKIKRGIVPDNFLNINDTNVLALCSFSSDLWYNLRKSNPEIAKNLFFFPVDDSIPMDAVVVLKSRWDKEINSFKNNFIDMLKLRNIDISIDRDSVVRKSLRYMMKAPMDTSSYGKLYDSVNKSLENKCQ